ncbi:hypothetical protein [Sphingobium terrigena]|uniref:hypothetical protein n=1 Tax=Sphingobium terrigena TaxID=2304063 RepID=UPI001601721E|nr:hypothetical protein [Sphingobium terrigena]
MFLTPEGEEAFRAALQVEIELHDKIFGWMGKEAEASFFAIVDEITAKSNTPDKKSAPKRLSSRNGRGRNDKQDCDARGSTDDDGLAVSGNRAKQRL